MTEYWINLHGGYYEGDRFSSRDASVPRRPSPNHKWNGTDWVAPPSRALVHRRITEDAMNPEGLGIWTHVKSYCPSLASDLYTALTGAGDEDVLLMDVANFLGAIIAALHSMGKPFSPAQYDRIDEILAQANFDRRIETLVSPIQDENPNP